MAWTLDGIPLRSVLVTRLRYLGDVVMSTVVLEALKLGDPRLRLGFLAEENHGRILSGHPLLDELHLLRVQRRGADAAARKSARPEATAPSASGALGTISRLRKARYDLAVDLFFNPRSAWLLRLAGIPHRIGGTRGSRRRLYSHTVLRREVAVRQPAFNAMAPGGLGEHLCRLAPLVHGPTGLDFPTWLVEETAGRLLKPGLVASPAGVPGPPATTPCIVLAPGATWPSKEWPAEHWRRLIGLLLENRTEHLYILQPPGNGHWAKSLAGVIPEERGGLLPVLSLEQVPEFLSRARLLITVDGGIMHTSVALSVPTLALFGPTRTDAWFPYTELGPYRVLCTEPDCHPCDLHQCDEFICLPGLDPELVVREALGLLG